MTNASQKKAPLPVEILQEFSATPVGSWLQRWAPLIFLVILALVIRVGYMPGSGFGGDLIADLDWIKTMQAHGLFSIYAQQTQMLIYPPISMSAFALTGLLQHWLAPEYTTLNDPQFVAFFKVFPILADVLLVIVLYIWLRHDKWLRWLIPGLLAVHPALVANSAWWGANDAMFTLVVVLLLLALTRDRSRLAWILFGLAVLTKQQALIVAPVLVVLSFRRYKLRRMMLDIAACALVSGVVLLPFVLESGFIPTLSPITISANNYPGATINALNFWYVAAPLSRGIVLKNWPDWPEVAIYNDGPPVVGPFSFKLLGIGMCGVFILLMCVSMWRHYQERREFVWAAAIYFGTFMLLTQMHERYMYAGAVLALIAIMQDRRLLLPAFALMFTLAFNEFMVATPLRWIGLNFWPRSVQTWVALLNMALLFELSWIAISGAIHSQQEDVPRPLVTLVHDIVIACRALAIALSVGIAITITATNYLNAQTAHWMVDHIADDAYVAVDQQAEMTMGFAQDTTRAQSWIVRYNLKSIEEKSVGGWYQQGVQYLLVDEKNTGMERGDFEQRLHKLENQGATLLYESPGVPALVPRQALMWSFKPQHPLDLTFDKYLRLAGYDVSPADDGSYQFLMYWYTVQAGAPAYQLFIHLLEPNTGGLIGQADGPLGQGVHPSDSWRRGEIVFDPATLPASALNGLSGPVHIEIGLYQLGSRQRAQITDGAQKAIGDSYTIDLP